MADLGVQTLGHGDRQVMQRTVVCGDPYGSRKGGNPSKRSAHLPLVTGCNDDREPGGYEADIPGDPAQTGQQFNWFGGLASGNTIGNTDLRGGIR